MIPTVSVIVPAFKRVEQTVITLRKITDSFDGEIIVVDSTPDNSLKHGITAVFKNTITYTRPRIPGIASAKNHGATLATGSVIIFCDSDIEIESNTIENTLHALQTHPALAGVTGQVLWKGGEKDKTHDRPRTEDRLQKIGKTTYIEAIYSRYFATYRDTFHLVGGYDKTLFNMRGEGSDLSIRYWRAGYPLGYDDSIIVHHVWNAPDSIALRVADPSLGIAKDLLFLSYKYQMVDPAHKHFHEVVLKNFPALHPTPYPLHPLYDFKPLEIFSQKNLFKSCIKNAEHRTLNPEP